MKRTKPVSFIVGLAFVCNVVFISSVAFTGEDLIVDAGDLGKIQGLALTTTPKSLNGSGRQYAAFLGMKYAEIPKRFLPSIIRRRELNATGDIYAAISPGFPCVQPGVVPEWVSEDCLSINVYTPNPKDRKLQPVIFFIHGGSFTIGQGSTYDGSRLLNKDVILVTMNYRLGILGFFGFNKENAPGNLAMYDIILALHWVRDYITYFGGDPNNITIAGQSAGAVAVTHFLASPVARGLFHRAICNSGTALAIWGTTENSVESQLRLAELSGCYNSSKKQISGDIDSTEVEKIMGCMESIPHPKLVEVLNTYQGLERKQGRLGFDVISPTIQSFQASPSFQKIVPEHPKRVFEDGRQANVPLLMGATKNDGSYVFGQFYNNCWKDKNVLNSTDQDLAMAQQSVPEILRSLGIPNEYGVYEFYDFITKNYLGNFRKRNSFALICPVLSDLFSVSFFKASAYYTALYHSRISNETYWYSFDFKGRQTIWNILFRDELPPFKGGITHGDDLIYLFHITGIPFNDDEQAVSNRMVDYWANFAYNGNPTPETTADSSRTTWPHLSESEKQFISIGKESTEEVRYEDTWKGAEVELARK